MNEMYIQNTYQQVFDIKLLEASVNEFFADLKDVPPLSDINSLIFIKKVIEYILTGLKNESIKYDECSNIIFDSEWIRQKIKFKFNYFGPIVMGGFENENQNVCTPQYQACKKLVLSHMKNKPQIINKFICEEFANYMIENNVINSKYLIDYTKNHEYIKNWFMYGYAVGYINGHGQLASVLKSEDHEKWITNTPNNDLYRPYNIDAIVENMSKKEFEKLLQNGQYVTSINLSRAATFETLEDYFDIMYSYSTSRINHAPLRSFNSIDSDIMFKEMSNWVLNDLTYGVLLNNVFKMFATEDEFNVMINDFTWDKLEILESSVPHWNNRERPKYNIDQHLIEINKNDKIMNCFKQNNVFENAINNPILHNVQLNDAQISALLHNVPLNDAQNAGKIFYEFLMQLLSIFISQNNNQPEA